MWVFAKNWRERDSSRQIYNREGGMGVCVREKATQKKVVFENAKSSIWVYLRLVDKNGPALSRLGVRIPARAIYQVFGMSY